MGYIKASNTYDKNEDGSYTVHTDKVGKIAGTFLGPIMGLSPWNTPFSTACKILRIWDEDIGDNPKVKAGKILEPVMLNYLDKSGRLPNTQAEVLFPGYEEGSHIDWKSHFDDEIFSGHVDAIAGHVTDAKAGIGIIENKTTSDASGWDWINNIPPAHYWLQASLYAYILGYDTIYFTVGILTPADVDNPYKFIPTEDNVKIMKVGLYPNFEQVLDSARQWYKAYIAQKRTPAPNMAQRDIDGRICAILDAQKCTADIIMPKIKAYSELCTMIGDLEKERDAVKEEIIAYLEGHNIQGVGSGDLAYKLGTYERKAVDTDKMKADGIYDAYIKKTIYKQFKKGKV